MYEIQLYMIIFSYVTKEIDNTGQENIYYHDCIEEAVIPMPEKRKQPK